MGYYIETETPHEKAVQLVRDYGAKVVSREEADKAMDNSDLAVIVVLDNGFFDAAGFAYNRREFDAFACPTKNDTRPRTFLTMNRQKVIEMTGYRGE